MDREVFISCLEAFCLHKPSHVMSTHMKLHTQQHLGNDATVTVHQSIIATAPTFTLALNN